MTIRFGLCSCQLDLLISKVLVVSDTRRRWLAYHIQVPSHSLVVAQRRVCMCRGGHDVIQNQPTYS